MKTSASSCTVYKMMEKWLQVLMVLILMGGLISALPLETEGSSSRVRRNTDCIWCPAGKHSKSCTECSDCPTGSYTSQNNRETICHSCYKDCRPELHMQVVKNCSRQSDVECRCMDGYYCSNEDHYKKRCRTCLPIPTSQSTTTTSATQPDPESRATQRGKVPAHAGMEVWIVVVVVLSTILSVFITLHLCRRRKKCLKNLVKRCSHANQKGDVSAMTFQASVPIRPTQAEQVDSHPPSPTSCISDIPTPLSASSTEQPAPPPGNLGPLHIYGAGTVFVSLLNQFGQNGREKDEERLQQAGLNEGELHGPSSPPLPLSTEENCRDSRSIFFPSQEQGKECHMSKEEGL